MAQSVIVGGSAALSILWAMLSSGLAQEATPAAAILPVPPAACTIEPRPIKDLRAMVMQGIDDYVTGATPVPRTFDAAELGVPADAKTVAAVTETIHLFTACTNAGDVPSMAALSVDEMMTRSMGRVAVFAGHVLSGGTGTPAPAETPSAAAIDLFLTSMQFGPAMPEASWASILEIRDVRTLADGRVRATVVTASQEEPIPETDVVYLRWERGRWLIEGAAQDEEAESGTLHPSMATPEGA